MGVGVSVGVSVSVSVGVGVGVSVGVKKLLVCDKARGAENALPTVFRHPPHVLQRVVSRERALDEVLGAAQKRGRGGKRGGDRLEGRRSKHMFLRFWAYGRLAHGSFRDIRDRACGSVGYVKAAQKQEETVRCKRKKKNSSRKEADTQQENDREKGR